MKIPNVPENEALRIETLRALNILDTPPEERFDRLTRMAKRLFGVPIALVSLVDQHRQWFKSSDGLSITDAPRDVSFCGHAILDEALFVIEDATEDLRFAANPMVQGEPHIRFYAGCALTAANGCKLGTLCIIDTEPRHFDDEDAQALKDLAAMVEGEIAAMNLATEDDLTGLLNRRGFLMVGSQLLKSCARQHLSGVLVFIDLNELKDINERWGQKEGDRVLQFFAEVLRQELCSSDMCARLSGDEFVLLLTDSHEAKAEVIVQRLAAYMEAYKQKMSLDYLIGFSHRMVDFDANHPMDLDDLMVLADTLMD